MKKHDIPSKWQWFNEARYGMFIHWGPYAIYGRGEQVLNRELLDHREYAQTACQWNPKHYDPKVWAQTAVDAGMKYAVLTTRHCDGYCLWDTQYTDYSSAAQAPQRDFVREYVEAFRAAGLRVGLYYSLIDLRIPAWFDGPEKDPQGWQVVRTHIDNQIKELLTNYGKIDVLWFDSLWPHTAKTFDSHALIQLVRTLQPDILINDRLEWPQFSWFWQDKTYLPATTPTEQYGDFGTPEQGIYADTNYLWESCYTSYQRLWGYTQDEPWHDTAVLLKLLLDCASQEGNFLLNVGPTLDGLFPPEYVLRVQAIGQWLKVHGEAIYGSEHGNITEFITHGWQTVKENNLYLILRTYDDSTILRVHELATPVRRATLLTTGQDLPFTQQGDELILHNLPRFRPTQLYPVIKLECASKPTSSIPLTQRIWGKDATHFKQWASARGTSVWVDGKPR